MFAEFDRIMAGHDGSRPVAPKDLNTICFVVDRVARQTALPTQEVWDYMVFGEYYWMPYVYAVTNGKGKYKIGQTSDPETRISSLQVGSPDRLTMIRWIECLPCTERKIHRHLEKYSIGGEWFKNSKRVKRVIELIANKNAKELYELCGIRYSNAESRP